MWWGRQKGGGVGHSKADRGIRPHVSLFKAHDWKKKEVGSLMCGSHVKLANAKLVDVGQK